MAASGFTIRMALPKGVADLPRLNTAIDRKEFLQALDGVLWQLIGGTFPPGATGAASAVIYSQPGGSQPVFGTGTITLSSASGSVTATIAGQATSVTASGGDVATAAALAAAINAQTAGTPAVNKLVSATNLNAAGVATNVVTLTALVASVFSYFVTTTASGTGCTAQQARLSTGAGDDVAVNTLKFF